MKIDACPLRRDLPHLPRRRIRILAARARLRRVDRAVVGRLEIVEAVRFLDARLAPGGSGLHVEAANHGHHRIVGIRAAVAVGEVEDAVGDVAAERLVQHERRRHVAALIAWILDADPARGVDRAIVVDERDPRVVDLHVLPDAAVRNDDHVARRIVRAALGGVDRAVDLHVRRHRVECAVGRRVDGQAQSIPDGVGLWPRGRWRLLRHECADCECDQQRRGARHQQSWSFHRPCLLDNAVLKMSAGWMTFWSRLAVQVQRSGVMPRRCT